MTILVNVTYAQPIQIVTEQYPPYNYEQDGEIKGIGTEVVQAVFKEAGMAANIKVYPWARAYKNALKRENVLIYSISRTQQREKFFKWVGVIVPIDFYIYSLIERTDIHIDQLEGAQQYSIGTVRSDALEQLFTGKGFSKVHKSISNKIVMEMLFAERLDLWPISELAANHLLLQNNHALSSVRKVYHLEGFSSDGLYMAFGLQTSDSVVSTFKDALESIKRKGIYQDIIDKYVE
ncbi:substrate-binding periplasmic protein [Psychromonas sp. Urea-02u-13]|uniref:substrate-binding periplasmic protein n=1 Tax=Psychromonas sp. Urea-02u-13 TaxID=2058326 RepID=UPI0012FEB221|nr:transporter substrate-binding domain-containing protein [Psychromonas sp. Urea-02u-13]